jgi:hypothetical protein
MRPLQNSKEEVGSVGLSMAPGHCRWGFDWKISRALVVIAGLGGRTLGQLSQPLRQGSLERRAMEREEEEEEEGEWESCCGQSLAWVWGWEMNGDG